MKFDFSMPVRLVSGEDCVKKHPELLVLGSKALIVTGLHSAKLCGALNDVTTILETNNIDFVIFDKVRENPMAEMCHEGGKICRESGCDFLIAIGGGSPIDAAKAIAAYARDEKIGVTDIFTAGTKVECLPIAAIPTTAGTGSEANPYAVLTLPGGSVKKTFRSPTTYPKTAFVDAKYTLSLSPAYTVSCALDALAHAIESYLSPKSTVESELFALWAAKNVWEILFQTESTTWSLTEREQLLYASCAAGIAINQTGTGFPHPLGYSLTLSEGIPHGRACGAFEGAYLAYNERCVEGQKKLAHLYAYLGVSGDEMKQRIPEKAAVQITLTPEQIKEHVARVSNAGNYANSPYVLTKEEMIEIYAALFS